MGRTGLDWIVHGSIKRRLFIYFAVLFALILLAVFLEYLVYHNPEYGILPVYIVDAIALAFLVYGFFMFNNTILKPLHQLHQATNELQKGNFTVRTNLRTGDEFEVLGKTFNKAVESLQVMDKERKEIDDTKTRLLSITSHELRSPLTPMIAQLQMLSHEYFGKLSKKQGESVAIILKNTNRLDHILRDFLEVSRVEASRLKFHYVKTNLKKEIEILVKEMMDYMPEKKIRIETVFGKMPVIETDVDKVVGQVLRNFLTNAIKFSPKNGKIVVTAGIKNGVMQMSVKDNGIGIPVEQQHRIFDPFFQAERTIYREYQGTGLGLTLCRGFVEAQGGRIWLESKPGKGSTFYFTVPPKPTSVVKPVSVLFSPTVGLEEHIKHIFVNSLGPLGEAEFKEMRREGLRPQPLRIYLRALQKEGILQPEQTKKMQKELFATFTAHGVQV